MYSIDGQTTIVAISSALNGGARGIVRLSGEKTREILTRFFENGLKPRTSRASSALNEENEETVPKDLNQITRPGCFEVDIPLDSIRSFPGWLYYWPNNRSYTGEPSAEIHTISCLPLLNRVQSQLIALGAVPAQGGEFTFRAFLSGKLDLTQAEAVLGLIEAGDENAFRTAAAQLAGGLSNQLNAVRERLLDALVQLEAGFDFTEEDISFISADALKAVLSDSLSELKSLHSRLSEDDSAGRQIKVVLCGAPNVGKSSLFNRLLNQSAAIVSSIQGSTRDYLTQSVRWSGQDFMLIDTAGRDTAGRDTADRDTAGRDTTGRDTEHLNSFDAAPFANIAVQSQFQADRQTRQAQVRLLCLREGDSLSDWQRDLLRNREVAILVFTQSDRKDEEQTKHAMPEADRAALKSVPSVRTSCITGEGIAELKQQIIAWTRERNTAESEILASTSTRCRQTLSDAIQSLERAKKMASDPDFYGEELVAEQIRRCLDLLGVIVGAVYTDDILDGVFSRFCVGK